MRVWFFCVVLGLLALLAVFAVVGTIAKFNTDRRCGPACPFLESDPAASQRVALVHGICYCATPQGWRRP